MKRRRRYGFPPRRTFVIQKNNDSIPFQVNLLGCVLHLLLPLIKIPRSEEMVLGPSTKMKFTIPLLATWSSLSLECLQVGAVQEFTYLHCYYNSSVCWTRHPAIQQNSYLADWLTDIVSLCCHCHIHRCGTAAATLEIGVERRDRRGTWIERGGSKEL